MVGPDGAHFWQALDSQAQTSRCAECGLVASRMSAALDRIQGHIRVRCTEDRRLAWIASQVMES